MSFVGFVFAVIAHKLCCFGIPGLCQKPVMFAGVPLCSLLGVLVVLDAVGDIVSVLLARASPSLYLDSFANIEFTHKGNIAPVYHGTLP